MLPVRVPPYLNFQNWFTPSKKYISNMVLQPLPCVSNSLSTTNVEAVLGVRSHTQ